MKAMILCAGYGKRLQPLTQTVPKPLLKIGKETLLSNTIKFLEKFGVEEAIINVHHLGDKIKDYINKNKFNLNINIVEEKENILDTGGGVLNAIKFFSDQPFLTINPDTIWNENYLEELKIMKKNFFVYEKCNCLMLVVDKKKSFDKNFKGDFDLENNKINRKNKINLKFVYTGLQILRPEVFFNLDKKVFSINIIWDELIKKEGLYGIASGIEFLHISNLNVYNSLIKKI